MLKKVITNLLYNIVILFMIISTVWGFGEKRYSIVIAGIFGLALFVFLKLRIIREIKFYNKKDGDNRAAK